MMYPAIPELLYITDVSLLAGEKLYGAAYAAVPSRRKEKADRLRQPKDKMLSLGAGLLLRRAMRDCGIPEDVVPGLQGNGKPFFPAYPAFHFSLSHAGTYAVCAVSPRDVGCDVEQIRSDTDVMKLAKRFFLPSEVEYLETKRVDALKTQEFFRLWTMKEAFMKVTGQGMKLPPDAFEIVPHADEKDPDVPQYGPVSVLRTTDADGFLPAGIVYVEEPSPRDCRFSVRQSFDDRSYFFTEYSVGDFAYRLSVCAAETPFRAEAQQTDIRDLLQ